MNDGPGPHLYRQENVNIFFVLECNCPMNRTKENNCNNRTGACLCLEKYEGEYCERCKMGYFDFPECKGLYFCVRGL